jgi:hypothetical protein
MFFISCGVVIGIISLLPSYFYSSSQEKNSIKKLDLAQKSAESKGFYDLIDELKKSEEDIKKLKGEDLRLSYSSVVDTLLTYRTSTIKINSIQISSIKNATSTADVVIQGKASTREALLAFKKYIEQDSSVSNVEMPISDLAKNKDSAFAIRLKFKKPNEIKL